MSYIKTYMRSVYRLFSCLAIATLLIVANSAQAQEGEDFGEATEKASEDTKKFFSYFTDWVMLSHIHRSGENAAQVDNLFNTFLKDYSSNPILQDILSAFSNGELGLSSEAFFQQTGIRLYFVGNIDLSQSDPRFEPVLSLLNESLSAKIETPSSPYIIVTNNLSGSNDAGYKITTIVRYSDEIKAGKYNLDKSDSSNPFMASLNPSASRRNEAGNQIKEAMMAGIATLSANVKENYKPNLMLAYRDKAYKSGEKIEVAVTKDGTITLEALNKELLPPNRTVEWSISPDNDQSSRAAIENNKLTFPTETGGEFAILASAGSDEVNVTLKIQGLGQDLKDFLKKLLLEALKPRLEAAIQQQSTLKGDSTEASNSVVTNIKNVENANFPLEGAGQELSVLQEPTVLSDTSVFAQSEVRTNAFKSLRRKKDLLKRLEKVYRLVSYINKVLEENDQEVKDLVDALVENSGELLAQFVITGLSKNDSTAMKDIVANFLDDNLGELAGTSGESAFATFLEPIDAPRGLPSGYSAGNNYYISPLVPLEDREQIIANIAAYHATQQTPTFVVINYSQDVSMESYLARASTGAPKGLESGQDYVVINYVNIPGSVIMTRAGYGDGDTEEIDDLLEGEFEESITSVEIDESLGIDVLEIKTFLTPAGIPFTTPSTTTKLSFVSSSGRAPYGTMTGYWTGEDYYVAVYEGQNFKGYSKLIDSKNKIIEEGQDGETIYQLDTKIDPYTTNNQVVIGFPHKCKIYIGTKSISELGIGLQSENSTGSGNTLELNAFENLSIETVGIPDQSACNILGLPDCEALYEKYKDSPLMQSDILARVINDDHCVLLGMRSIGEGLGYETEFMKGVNTLVGGFAVMFTVTAGAAVVLPILIEGAVVGGTTVTTEVAIEKSVSFAVGSTVDGIIQLMLINIENDDISLNEALDQVDLAQMARSGGEAMIGSIYVEMGVSCVGDALIAPDGSVKPMDQVLSQEGATDCVIGAISAYVGNKAADKLQGKLKDLVSKVKANPERFIKLLTRLNLDDNKIIDYARKFGLQEDVIRLAIFRIRNAELLSGFDQADDLIEDLTGNISLLKGFNENVGFIDRWTSFRKAGLDDLARNPVQLQKFDDLVKNNNLGLDAERLEDLLLAPKAKGLDWDNPEDVLDAVKRASDAGIDGISISHKKFPEPAEGKSSFVLDNAKQYQREASGDAALSFDKGGRSFDNIDADEYLIDRKYGHGSSVFNSDGSVKNQSRANSILEQGRAQVAAADGAPIRWEISTELGADGIQELFDNAGIDIEVIHVVQETIID